MRRSLWPPREPPCSRAARLSHPSQHVLPWGRWALGVVHAQICAWWTRRKRNTVGCLGQGLWALQSPQRLMGRALRPGLHWPGSSGCPDYTPLTPWVWLEAEPRQAVADLHLTSQDSEPGSVLPGLPREQCPRCACTHAPHPRQSPATGQDGQADAAATEGGPCTQPHIEDQRTGGGEGPP